MYLNGFINLFKDLSEAYMILTIPFWRYVFDSLSRSNTKPDNQVQQLVRGKIKKKIGKSQLAFLHTDDGLDFLTDLIQKQSEILSQNELIVSQKYFTKYTVDKFKKNTPANQQGQSQYLNKDRIGKNISPTFNLEVHHIVYQRAQPGFDNSNTSSACC